MLACLTLFQNGKHEVRIKARGRAISRAVDVAEVVVGRFVPDAKVEKVEIGTEILENEESGEPVSVSAMEIRLSRSA